MSALLGEDPYVVTSERLEFRRWNIADEGLALSLWGDERVTRLIGASAWTVEEVRERLQREIHHEKQYGVQYWPMFERASGEHVGCCGLCPYEQGAPESGARAWRAKGGVAELGFHLHPSHWGRGYATEAAQAVARYGFEVLGVAALFAGHHPKNQASQGVLQKLGFVYTGLSFYPRTGLEHPSYFLSCAEFSALHDMG